MRGFLTGSILGVVTIAAVGTVISLLMPLPSGPDVASETPMTAQAVETQADSDVGHVGMDADLVNVPPTMPAESKSPTPMQNGGTDPGMRPVVGGDSILVNPKNGDTTTVETGTATTPPAITGMPAMPVGPSGPEGSDTISVDLGTIETASARQPDVGIKSGAMAQPDATGKPADVGGAGEPSVAPMTAGDAPMAPATDTKLAMSSDPAQPAMPNTSVAGTEFSSPATELALPIIAASDDAAPVTLPGTEAVTQAAAERNPTASTDSTPPPRRAAALPQAGASSAILRPTLGTPVVPLTERHALDAATGTAEMAAEIVAEITTEPPLVLYSQPFRNPANKPLMAIILIDDKDSIGVEALVNFPQPITMAIDPSAPDAAERMARHRAAGFEVVALINLPAGATAQDAEVALAASFDAMPEVVGILEGTTTGFQGNRELADQVSAIVAGSGHGLIMHNKGLNTVYKLAVRDGVPAGLVFRDFDGAGQTGTVMRRFLDQAAFRAGRVGGVIMLGRIRPDTISALLIWALQDRVSRIALAPVSALLRSKHAQ